MATHMITAAQARYELNCLFNLMALHRQSLALPSYRPGTENYGYTKHWLRLCLNGIASVKERTACPAIG